MRQILGGILSTCAIFGADIDDSSESSTAIAARIPKLETGFEGDHLTGSWGGFRDKMVEHGIHFYAGYTGEALGNVSGGWQRGAIYEGLLELGLDLDSAKLGLWENGLVHISSIYPHGSGLSEKYVGDLMGLSNIDAYDSIRLYDCWFQQTFLDGKFSLRVGQLLADEEFALTDSQENFIHSAFGWPAFISGNAVNTGPAFYVATPGLRLRVQPNENFFLQTAVFDGDSFDSPIGDPHVNSSGTHFHLSDDQGVFWLSEFGYRLNPGSKEKLDGQYKVGFWLHTGDFLSNFHDRNGDPFIVTGLEPFHHSENYGGFLVAEQTLWRKEERKVSIFGRFGASPPDRSLFEWVFNGGLTMNGPFPRRTDDQLGVGFAYAKLSRDIEKTERLDARMNGVRYDGFSHHESVLEVFYNAQLTKWWTIQPDLQWIFDPGGNSGAPDALVIGVRTSVVF